MDAAQLAKDFESLTEKFASAQGQVQSLNAELTSTREKLAQYENEKALFIARNSHGGESSMDSMETRVLKSFGCNHVKDLMRVNVAHPRFGAVDMGTKSSVMQLKKDVDTARYIAQMFYGEPLDKEIEKDKDDERGLARVRLLDTQFAKEVDLAARLKAFGSTVSGAGDEWVPTLISSQFIDEYQLAKQVPGLFREIPMPSNPFELPVKKDSTVARLVAEGAEGTGTNFGTTKVTFNAKKLYEYYPLPDELNEDSAPAILDVARMDVVESQIRAMERAIIDGDTTTTHMDSDVTSSDDARKAWMGLRKLALANSATVTFTSALAKAKLLEMKGAMGKFGVNPRELVWIVSSLGSNQFLSLDEVMTVDKIGERATILQGALAAYLGIPIVVSEYMRENLNASGVYDGATTNNTGILLVNHRRFYVGMRRPIRVKVAMDARPEFDRWQLVSYQRAAFAAHAQSATEKSVVYGIDVTV